MMRYNIYSIIQTTFSLTFHSKFSLEVSAATSSPATALPLSWIQMTSQVPWFVSVSPLRVISERCLFLVIPPTKSNDNLECTIWSNRFILMWVGRYSEARLDFSIFETTASWVLQHSFHSHIRSESPFLSISACSLSYAHRSSTNTFTFPCKDPTSDAVV